MRVSVTAGRILGALLAIVFSGCGGSEAVAPPQDVTVTFGPGSLTLDAPRIHAQRMGDGRLTKATGGLLRITSSWEDSTTLRERCPSCPASTQVGPRPRILWGGGANPFASSTTYAAIREGTITATVRNRLGFDLDRGTGTSRVFLRLTQQLEGGPPPRSDSIGYAEWSDGDARIPGDSVKVFTTQAQRREVALPNTARYFLGGEWGAGGPVVLDPDRTLHVRVEVALTLDSIVIPACCTGTIFPLDMSLSPGRAGPGGAPASGTLTFELNNGFPFGFLMTPRLQGVEVASQVAIPPGRSTVRFDLGPGALASVGSGSLAVSGQLIWTLSSTAGLSLRADRELTVQASATVTYRGG